MSSREGAAADGRNAARDSFNEYDWVASAKTATFSLADDASDKLKGKKAPSSNSSLAGSAISEVSCGSLSILEWASDLLSSNESKAQDVFQENDLPESPLRHRRIPAPRTPNKVRQQQQGGTFSAEQRLPKNDLPGPLCSSFPNWEGATINADARKLDEVSVMTPMGLGETLNHPIATLSSNSFNDESSENFGNWDRFESAKWHSCQESSNQSDSVEVDAIYRRQAPGGDELRRWLRRQTRNKKKLFWVASIAIFFIMIIAIAVPLSKKSKNASANISKENISTGEGGLVNGQATIVPAVVPSPSKPSPSAPTLTQQDSEPISPSAPTAEESNQNSSPSAPAPAPTPLQPTPSASSPFNPQTDESNNSPVSTAEESNQNPSPSVPAPAPTPLQPTPSASSPFNPQTDESNNSPVSTAEESNQNPSPSVPAPAPTPLQPTPSASSPFNPQTDESNNSPVSTAEESNQNPSPSVPAPAPTPLQPKPSASSPFNPQTDESNNSPQPSLALTPNPTRLPTNKPTPSCIKVSIKADKFGHETSWVLQNVDSNTVVGSVPEDTYNAYEESSTDICGLEAGKFSFTINDKYGDGMCCGNGDGKFRVYLNDRQILWGGNFGKSMSFDIIVGYDPGVLTDREYQYLFAHNNRRKDFHEKHGKEYVPLVWSNSLAGHARVWATSLLDECEDESIRHDPNRNGDGENLAKNLGNRADQGLGQMYPVESIVTRWVEREMNFAWPENAHLTQALWRGSTYLGCGEAEETKSDGSICRVQVCRYRRAGNCDLPSFGNDWLTAMLEDDSRCGPICPDEGCYV